MNLEPPSTPNHTASVSRGARRAVRALLDSVGNAVLQPPRSGFGYFKNHGPRAGRRLALTFDDGPSSPSTGRLLDVLGELKVRATFFCVGQNVRKNPKLVERAFAEGHVIANHSMQHERLPALDPFAPGAHIDDAAREIADVIGCRPLLYRPPWGWLTPWEGRRLFRRGYRVVGWDVSTSDWLRPCPNAASMVRDIRPLIQGGSILLFHDGRAFLENWEAPETLAAIRLLVPALLSEEYEFVTAAELLDVPAYERRPV